jgi:hypothetical protein
MSIGFNRATKGKKPVRIVIGGPSGSGKTYTSLTFAQYLAGVTKKPTAVIDTEHYRASLYADKYSFDVNNWEPPFDPRELTKAIHEVEQAGYGQLIVDSSTHFYSGQGGLLEIVSDAAKTRYGGNQYAGWAVGTPVQNELVDTIIRSPLHVIFCTRAKQAYEETEKNGKKTYEKTGMELQQRDGFEYDFDFSLMMDMDNNAVVEKGMGLVTLGMYIKKPDYKTIENILKSINENTTEDNISPIKIGETQKQIIDLCKDLGGTSNKTLMALLKEYIPDANPNHLSDQTQLSELLSRIEEMKKENS